MSTRRAAASAAAVVADSAAALHGSAYEDDERLFGAADSLETMAGIPAAQLAQVEEYA
jgi:hypothetical protein